ncbi:MAG: dihydroneopterin aldolase [Pseudomonadota bacterium]|jgi:dihydroneopterin aldolase
MDIVFLHEFKIDTVIGIYEWERELPQTVQLDLEIGLPHSRAAETDDVADTIDYGAVVERIRTSLTQRRFSLVEALAEHVAQIILAEFGAPWAKVSVTKLGLIRGVKRVGITIERGSRL